MRKLLLLAGAAALLPLAFGAAHAATIDFGLNALGNTDEGAVHTFSNGGVSIIATAEKGGQVSASTTDDLYGKQTAGSPDENGLGTTADLSGDHEIQAGRGYVQIDISGLVGKVTGATVDFGTNSVTQGEQWAVWGSNTPDLTVAQLLALPLAQELSSGNTEVTNIGLADVGKYKYLDFIAVGHDSTGAPSNFLITDITATPLAAPEPASLALLGVGLIGIGAVVRKSRA